MGMIRASRKWIVPCTLASVVVVAACGDDDPAPVVGADVDAGIEAGAAKDGTVADTSSPGDSAAADTATPDTSTPVISTPLAAPVLSPTPSTR